MISYYMDLALRSMRRNKVLTALMVVAIGLGIGASMTMLTVLHVMTADPLPGRSGQLYRPYLNPLPLDYKNSFGPDPSLSFTWPDARALLHARKGVHQAAMARGSLTVVPDRPGAHPESVSGSYTTRDFFAMFGVSFTEGRAWSRQADRQHAPVVVLTQKLAFHLFGDQAAVGRVAHLGEHEFQVVGVVRDWHPRPFFYAGTQTPRFSATDQFFLPLSTAMDLGLHVNSRSAWGEDQSLTSAKTSWLQFWVQLDTPAKVKAYRTFIANYARQQKSIGRFAKSETRMMSLMQWLDYNHVVPSNVKLQAWLAFAFLAICLFNTVGLLLAKFLRRAGEIGVRRALGASRSAIFGQCLSEAGLIGLFGGIGGWLLTLAGLWLVRNQDTPYADLVHLDLSMFLVTFVLAFAVSLLAGTLPALRASRITPALQLKTL